MCMVEPMIYTEHKTTADILKAAEEAAAQVRAGIQVTSSSSSLSTVGSVGSNVYVSNSVNRKHADIAVKHADVTRDGYYVDVTVTEPL